MTFPSQLSDGKCRGQLC